MTNYCDDCGKNEATGKYDIAYFKPDGTPESVTRGRPLCDSCATARKVK